ncbi:MAG: C-GCAxxG-C-C family protein [Sedimentibacter sp.]|uniref:C-GCAxxG-C-C family protein n=1 Tax=Sedimentibacter sp. TaxID=1960295 RepID=UPI002981E307|nr:C-GCAxxG-C-C family protein [Sedimentibacter sp.]MDW5299325.1 C-GCAxxG-C-C family protein [Sedimentibacter sp.]
MGENLEKVYSRRDMLKTAGKATAGIAIVGVVPSILAACSQPAPQEPASVEIPSKEVLNYEYKEASKDAPAFPFPYQKLDVATTQERAYASFFNKGGCCVATADALIGQLADNAGYPFNQIPMEAFKIGAGGFGAASLCGSLAGCARFISLVVPSADAPAMVAELFTFYKESALPIYQPEVKSETVISGSVNCADSVGPFISKTGLEMADPKRKARCAGVAADCAGKTVELVNKYFGV